MKNRWIAAAAISTTLAALTLGGCAYGGRERVGVSVAGGNGYYDGYYDGSYGAFRDGYWGNDGFFWYQDNGRSWHRDDGHHFRRDGFAGFNKVRGSGMRREH